ncbi:MAG: AMP-binding protein [Mizugakiibacter sp.]|uniref:AMP-binding protein n=1 Tax=Mizugakiibacter sp. TaxID=1972610 RepID=UPI00320CD63C
MSVVFETQRPAAAATLPLLHAGDPSRPFAWRDGHAVSAAQFIAEARALAARLPQAPCAVNLCEDRYAFLVTFCAVALRGQANLLPPSRAPQVVDEVLAAHPGSYALGEQALEHAPPGYLRVALPRVDAPELCDVPLLPAGQVIAVGYTSGSTGTPRANPKTLGGFHLSTACNRAVVMAATGGPCHAVATVPAQHMYGMEMSVLLPLLGEVAIHAGRPFFPADVAHALAEIPAPRVLVTTPVHLRTLVAAAPTLPPLAAIVSATAPLSAQLAREAEARFGAAVVEVFGSTETCVIAHRRTAREDDWTLYPGVRLHPQPDGTLVEAPHLTPPVALADVVELPAPGRFRLCGRNTDLLEIAGKRASLGDLTRRLLAIPGVEDGVVFQLDAPDPAGVRRIAALAVAPMLAEADILAALRRAVDPVFLPRPLKRVAALPRNDTGKLPRAALLALLGREG